jgi:hypothetical protein
MDGRCKGDVQYPQSCASSAYPTIPWQAGIAARRWAIAGIRSAVGRVLRPCMPRGWRRSSWLISKRSVLSCAVRRSGLRWWTPLTLCLSVGNVYCEFNWRFAGVFEGVTCVSRSWKVTCNASTKDLIGVNSSQSNLAAATAAVTQNCSNPLTSTLTHHKSFITIIMAEADGTTQKAEEKRPPAISEADLTKYKVRFVVVILSSSSLCPSPCMIQFGDLIFSSSYLSTKKKTLGLNQSGGTLFSMSPDCRRYCA